MYTQCCPRLSVIVRLALRVPVLRGVKVTLTEQLLPGASWAPHVFWEITKSPGFLPVITTLLMERSARPVFFRLAFNGCLVCRPA
jgi:hypothetical protein